MKAHGKESNLTLMQEKAIAALLISPTITAAAERCGVSGRTLRTWLKRPYFAAAYEDARARVVPAALNHLQVALGDALTALARDTRSEVFAERQAASALILEAALKGIELGDVLARLRVIEAERDKNAQGNHDPAAAR
jgi:hypothetical protein